ncbi:hypothetical protein [Cytobacillus praedii]|uniref:hypothetical protein n=1 Tax=Cytobacillus praedii TaxID=1742358 RepID=UPI002E1DA57C|nr:hypothetical protein [Cytobacillus praedii]
MKNFFIIITLTFFIVFSVSLSNVMSAKSIVQSSSYATTEDVLIALLLPHLDNIVTKEYKGNRQSWNIARIEKVSFETTKKPIDHWYEMKILIQVFDNTKISNKSHLDCINLRLDISKSKTLTRNNLSLNDIIKLISYENNQPKN